MYVGEYPSLKVKIWAVAIGVTMGMPKPWPTKCLSSVQTLVKLGKHTTKGLQDATLMYNIFNISTEIFVHASTKSSPKHQ